ncbi:ABC transporter permease [Mucilaginibacter endophyticus]|uniref:ABC transporter permease n=1 Tax=Mucilaginibacter endophyticus TaxID=2675003 RepID=UPI000E0CD368|nr:ABC transporter permease [Mucilaginibacter endophyticus]
MNPYFFHIRLYDLASLGILFTGITLALLLGFAKRPAKAANLFLSLALVVMVLKAAGLTPLFLSALGPLLYFYVRQLTCPTQHFHRKNVLHFCPLLIGYWIPSWPVFISVIIYLYLSRRLIQDFYDKLRPVLMDRPRFAFRRLNHTLLLLGLLCLLSLVNNVFSFAIAFTLIVLAAERIMNPDSDIRLTMPDSEALDAREKGRRLKEAVAAGRFYEDAELTLATLAVKLAMHPHDLSRIINLGLKKNFSDFINEFRVREITRRMQDPAHDNLTLLGIAYESGFNSKTTFNRVFREITGKTPLEYKNGLKKKVPIDKLGLQSQTGQVILRSENPPNSIINLENHLNMIKNYLTIAFRNVKRQPFISFINIFGLTVGLTCCLLILSYIINETSYDKFNTNAKDIRRVTRTFYSSKNVESLHLSSIAPPFGPLLQHAFPDIKKFTRVLPIRTTSFHYKDKLFNEQNSVFAEENFFDFFTIPVVEGSQSDALKEPYSIMLSEAMARKYFGNADPIGKSLFLDNVFLGKIKHEFKVTGVVKAFPANSHMHPDLLMSFSTLKDPAIYGTEALANDFGGNAFFTYLLFPKDYNTDKIESQLPDFLDRYVHLGGTAGNTKTHDGTKLTFQKLIDIHLHSHMDDEFEENSDIKRVYIFSAIALFILIIACINYMNLSTARSALRAKEIGIRKVIGARRKEIIGQFLSESVLITWFALALAVAATALLLPMINRLSNISLAFNSLLQWHILFPVLSLPFIVGLISGIYPAIFMSSFLPVKVLKGIVKTGSGGVSFRKVLVVLQFSISIILIVATTVVYRQLQYIQNTDLGFNKDAVLTLGYTGDLHAQYDVFKTELLKEPAIKEVGRSSRIPSGRLLDFQGGAVLVDGVMKPINADLKCISTDYGFIPTYGMKMASGRNFSTAFSTDTNNFIINESAVRSLGLKTAENAIGKNMIYGNVNGKIIGIVKDFHFESLHQAITPLLFRLPPGNGYHVLSVKINGTNIQNTVNYLQTTWHKYLPETPFDFTFLDDKLGQLYRSEQQQGSLFTIFSCVAIFIACLGLFGLSAFTITQRVKEIGVRKILGANVQQIVLELSKDFILLVFIAVIIAIPIAAWAMHQWLADFAFHTEMTWWIFAAAGIMALIIAFITISFQSVRAALANPVKSLRSE